MEFVSEKILLKRHWKFQDFDKFVLLIEDTPIGEFHKLWLILYAYCILYVMLTYTAVMVTEYSFAFIWQMFVLHFSETCMCTL